MASLTSARPQSDGFPQPKRFSDLRPTNINTPWVLHLSPYFCQDEKLYGHSLLNFLDRCYAVVKIYRALHIPYSALLGEPKSHTVLQGIYSALLGDFRFIQISVEKQAAPACNWTSPSRASPAPTPPKAKRQRLCLLTTRSSRMMPVQCR